MDEYGSRCTFFASGTTDINQMKRQLFQRKSYQNMDSR